MLSNRFFKGDYLFLLLWCATPLLSMIEVQNSSPFLLQDILCTKIIPYLTLGEYNNLSRTNKTYNQYCKIIPIMCGLRGEECLLSFIKNYYKATHLLSWIAQNKDGRLADTNKKYFDQVYAYHLRIRNADLMEKTKKESISSDENIECYRKYYQNPSETNKSIILQLNSLINKNDSQALCIVLFSLEKCDLATIIPAHNFYTVLKAIYDMCVQHGQIDFLGRSIPLSNRTVYRVNIIDGLFRIKASEKDIIHLVDKNYLSYNSCGTYNCTLLHYAVVRNFVELTKYLLEKGAEVNKLNRWEKQPFYYALQHNRTDIIQCFYKYYTQDNLTNFMQSLIHSFLCSSNEREWSDFTINH
jgi:hypothetical protein